MKKIITMVVVVLLEVILFIKYMTPLSRFDFSGSPGSIGIVMISFLGMIASLKAVDQFFDL